jgi:porin
MTASAPGMLRARPLAGFAGALLAAALLFGWPAAPRAETPPAAVEANAAIAGNPGAVNIAPGTGALGRLLGLGPDSGLRFGGVLVSNGNVLLSGGNAGGATSFNNLLLIDGQADLDTLAHIPGASLGVAVLRFDGQPTNQQAGIVTGYNGLTGPPPLDRTELYELWWRQSFFADKLVLRIGKTVPTYDFGNVARPVPVQDVGLQIPAVSGLLYTPVFVNPTILGALPGYYNSAYGITVTLAPSRRLYLSAGIYDGNLARGQQTGLRGAPTINGYRFQIAEAGTAWLLGPDHLPGSLAVGAWDQTGTLSLSTPQGSIAQDGTRGVYAFASQRLWRGTRNGGASGVSGFVQLGANDSRTMLATRYAGLGLTAFGLIPSRAQDSFGAGIAWSTLNHNLDLRPDEILLQAYDQVHVIGDFYVQPALTVSPNPAEKTARKPAVAFTVQSTILF